MSQQASTEVLQLQAGRCVIRIHIITYRLFLTMSPGHQTVECTANRVFDTSLVADRSADDAWVALEKADEERDLDDFREVRASKI